MQFPQKNLSLRQTPPGVSSLMRPEELSPRPETVRVGGTLPTLCPRGFRVLWSLLRLRGKGWGTTLVLYTPGTTTGGPLL